jgi:hypothetical protein
VNFLRNVSCCFITENIYCGRGEENYNFSGKKRPRQYGITPAQYFFAAFSVPLKLPFF